jgi:N-methylhydantoinase A
MGGTSADFSVIAGGEPRMVTARKVDGQPLRIPTLDIETISAGGGSIAHVDLGGGLRVGPQSAGAEPGPACYGTGGRDATVTDAAVVLGIIDPAEFLGGEMRLDAALAREAVERNVARPLGLDAEAAALGIVRVANANMVQAIRRISVERGLDIRRFALLAFGGAGPIYGPFMARDLGMSEVLVPRNPGVFAAQGLLMADIRHSAQAALQRRLARIDGADLAARFAVLRERLDALLARDGVAPEDRSYRYAADMRCVGQFHELVVPLPAPGPGAWWDPAAIAATFHDVHERSYGHADRAVPVEVINLRVDGLGRAPRVSPRPVSAPASGTPRPAALRAVCLDPGNGYRETPVHRRDDLRPGHVLNGPAIVTQRDTTTVVLPGQQATVAANDVIRIGAAP